MGLFQFGSRHASCISLLAIVLALLTITPPAMGENISYVTTTDASGKTVYLPENRQPALYTRDFGDCLGGSLLNIERFDAGYYSDNMTVTFHLQGTTELQNASLISKLYVTEQLGCELTVSSVHLRLCLRRESIQSHFRPVRCKHL